jgi:hypothetical protein
MNPNRRLYARDHLGEQERAGVNRARRVSAKPAPQLCCDSEHASVINQSIINLHRRPRVKRTAKVAAVDAATVRLVAQQGAIASAPTARAAALCPFGSFVVVVVVCVVVVVVVVYAFVVVLKIVVGVSQSIIMTKAMW